MEQVEAKLNQYSASKKNGYYEEEHRYWDEKVKKGFKKGHYINGCKSGLWHSYTSSGNIYKENRYNEEGRFNGKFIKWFLDTNIIHYEGQYDENLCRSGTWTWYNEDGSLSKIFVYEENDLLCFSKDFDLFGNLIIETIFIN